MPLRIAAWRRFSMTCLPALVLCCGLLAAVGAGGCRRVPPAVGRATPARPAASAPTAPTPPPAVGEADRVGEVYELRRRVADVEARLRGLEAAAPARADAGVAASPAAPAAATRRADAPTAAGPPGPTGPTGPEGPPGPAVRLDTAPEKGDVYRRRVEQSLEAGETGAAVARCAGVHDAVLSGACSAEPAPLGALVQAGAYGLDDPKTAAGWRCEYRNVSPRRAITARAEVFCVPRKGKPAK